MKLKMKWKIIIATTTILVMLVVFFYYSNIEIAPDQESAIRIANSVSRIFVSREDLAQYSPGVVFDQGSNSWLVYYYCTLDPYRIGGGPSMRIDKKTGFISEFRRVNP